jgi:hypothetical protein
MATKGHVKDLPRKEIGIDLETGTFKPNWKPTGARVLAEIKRAAKNVSEIYIASDPDREGELIATHVAEVLKKYAPKRLRIYEITDDGVRDAFAELSVGINKQLASAAEARRVLDRLIGYKLSPFCWRGLGGGFDECRIYTYDTAVKNQIGWESPTYKIVDGVPNYVGEKGIYNMKSGSFVFQNPRFEYIVVDLNDLADAKLSVNLNPRFAVLTKNSNGKYVSECVIPETSFFTPKWTVKLDQSEYKVEPIYLTCKAKNTDDVKKCTEVLDRFVTTFRVK